MLISNVMQKFLLKTTLFFVLIAIIDVFSGKIFAYLIEHAKGGDNWRNNYICNSVNDDILIFGSSRAMHHYNPIIISDSLKLSCYNCGQDGNGVILNEARYQLILQRYKPKLLVYDVHPGFDLLVQGDNHKYFKWLKAYYDRTGIPEVFESVDSTEKYKMLSRMYRYNSNCTQIVSDYIHPIAEKGINGYIPKNIEFDTMKVRKGAIEHQIPVFDSLKISYIEKMVEESTGTKIVFVVSPYWNGTDTIPFQPIRDICKEKNIPFLDFSNNPKYVHNNTFFYDGSHLNARGADEYTKDFIIELKKHKII
jgi:hypothetical protein